MTGDLTMKDRARPLRREGSRHDTRVFHARAAQLTEQWDRDDGKPVRKRYVQRARTRLEQTNWRIERDSQGVVVAVEPGREYETPFDGPDAFWEAVLFAAGELRGGDDDHDTD